MAATFRNGPAYPPATRGKLVVWGLLGSFPFGGMTWQAIHHLVGLRRLGFDVWYVEEPYGYAFDPTNYELTEDYSANAAHIDRHLRAVGLGDRWMVASFHDENVAYNGDARALRALYRDCEAALNICGAQAIDDAHDDIGCLIYLQTDPVAPQIAVARGDGKTIADLDRYDHLFSYAVNLGRPGCDLPVVRYEWHPTVPPVVVDLWHTGEPPPAGACLTTVAMWDHNVNDVAWEGRTYRWTKKHEFVRFWDVPQRSALPLELALGAASDDDVALMGAHGWNVLPSDKLADPFVYRDYIRRSAGEFTVAKEQYHASRSGWFSDRSVCYLAAGRPVITQDTGFSTMLPVGDGLLAFSTEEEAVAAIASVAADHDRHCDAALAIARDRLEASKVLGDVLRTVGLIG